MGGRYSGHGWQLGLCSCSLPAAGTVLVAWCPDGHGHGKMAERLLPMDTKKDNKHSAKVKVGLWAWKNGWKAPVCGHQDKQHSAKVKVGLWARKNGWKAPPVCGHQDRQLT